MTLASTVAYVLVAACAELAGVEDVVLEPADAARETATGGQDSSATGAQGGAAAAAGGSNGASGAPNAGGAAGSTTDAADASDDRNDADAACQTLGADPDHVFVDVAARVEGTGTSDCPVRTISAGLALLTSSRAASRTLHVAAGRYDAAGGESFPFVISERVSILGAGKGKTVIRGGGDYDHRPFGGTLPGVHPSILVVRSEEPVVIRDLSLEPSAGTKYGILCLSGNAPQKDPPPDPFPEPTLIVDGVEMTGFEAALTASNTRSTACNVRVTRSTLTDNGFAVFALGCGYTATWGPYAALALGTNTTDGNLIARNRDYAAVALWGCVEHLRVVGNEFRDNNVGIHIDEYTTYQSSELLPVLEHNLFRRHTEAGVLIHNRGTVRALEDNRFEDNLAAPSSGNFSTGIKLGPPDGTATSPKILRARRNTFIGNDVALWFWGTDLVSDAVMDFGRADDPGNNVFRCNASPVATRTGFDVGLGINVPAGTTLPFAGNYWDHVPPTREVGAAANGTDLVITSARDWNVDVSGALPLHDACPEGQPSGP